MGAGYDRLGSLDGRRLVFVLNRAVLGGAERIALDLGLHFREHEGADVGFCALNDEEGRAREIAAEEGLPWTTIRVPWAGSRAQKAVSVAGFARGVARLRPDVLIPSCNLPNTLCGLTWRSTGARLCVWNQCDVIVPKRINHSLIRRAVAHTPVIATSAQHAVTWLVEQFGADPARIHAIYRHIQLRDPVESREEWRRRLDIPAASPAVVMLGHLHGFKDHETLLRAWRLVVDGPAAVSAAPVLLLAGRPSGTEDRLRAIAFDLELRPFVRFLGDVSDVSGLLAASDLAVFSSRSECLGRGATEPMGAGLAVAGTDIPGIREAVGERGRPFLAPPGDHAGLARALSTLLGDPVLREELGRANAALIADRHSEENTTGAYVDLVARGLSRAPARLRRRLVPAAAPVPRSVG